MPIDKVVNEAPVLDVVVTSEEETLPDIEIILEEDGSATVEIGEEDSSSVDFYANLAEVVDPDVLGLISSELGQIFDADKSSRQDWEQMYAKGLDLLGLKIEERTKPFRGAAGATHPMLTESIVQFQAQAMKELMPSGGPVRTQVLGKETIDKAQQAARVQDFMNYQITTVMEEYTPEFDQAFFTLVMAVRSSKRSILTSSWTVWSVSFAWPMTFTSLIRAPASFRSATGSRIALRWTQTSSKSVFWRENTLITTRLLRIKTLIKTRFKRLWTELRAFSLRVKQKRSSCSNSTLIWTFWASRTWMQTKNPPESSFPTWLRWKKPAPGSLGSAETGTKRTR
jgi:hypothetical protein